MHGEAGFYSGSRRLIFVSSHSLLSISVLVLYGDDRDLSLVHRGAPRMMELAGVAAGNILLNKLVKQERVYTDNYGLVSLLTLNSVRKTVLHIVETSNVP